MKGRAHGNSFAPDPWPGVFDQCEVGGSHHLLEVGTIGEMARVDDEVAIGGVARAERQRRLRGSQVHRLSADENDRVPVFGKGVDGVEEDSAGLNIEIRGIGHRRNS